MTKRRKPQGPGPSALEAAAIPHALRCWEAEVENARRLSVRVQVLLSLATAVLGVLFLRGWAPTEAAPAILRVLVVTLQAIAAGLVFASLVVVLRPRRRSLARPSAAHWMAWPRGDDHDPKKLSSEAARRISWEATTAATTMLRSANGMKQRDVDRGQALLLGGVGTALCGFLLMAIEVAAPVLG